MHEKVKYGSVKPTLIRKAFSESRLVSWRAAAESTQGLGRTLLYRWSSRLRKHRQPSLLHSEEKKNFVNFKFEFESRSPGVPALLGEPSVSVRVYRCKTVTSPLHSGVLLRMERDTEGAERESRR